MTGTGSGLEWIQEYLQTENTTGTGSGNEGGTVYTVRRKEGGGYVILDGSRQVGELPETDELNVLFGEEEEIILTPENMTGTGSGLEWIQEYLQTENTSGTGTGGGDLTEDQDGGKRKINIRTRTRRLEDILKYTVPDNPIYLQDNRGSGR